MTHRPHTLDFRELPVADRKDALAEIVEREFRTVLLMTDEDELPHDHSYFDLGLTSLGITDLKQRLEGLLGCEIDTTVLFNSPTIDSLLIHLTAQRPVH